MWSECPTTSSQVEGVAAFAAILALVVQAASVNPPSAAALPPKEVIVTARPLSALKADLDACLTRRCPPKEDIAASLAYSEAQFVAGDNPASEATLLAARHRNGRYAAELPVDVAGLHRATSRMADLNGHVDPSRIIAFDIVDALKAGLQRSDKRVLVARIEVGDVFAHEGRLDDALDRYRSARDEARRAHLPGVEGMALFRRAAILAAAASRAFEYRSDARKALAELEATTDVESRPFRNAGELIAVQFVPKDQRAAAAAKAVARMEPVRTDVPIVAYGPPILPDNVSFGVASGPRQADWADMSFTVAADGTVKEARLLQSSPSFPAKWTAWITRSLTGRRYMPMVPGSPAVDAERVERYSFIADQQVMANGMPSRMTGQTSGRRVTIIDMSVTSPSATSTQGG